MQDLKEINTYTLAEKFVNSQSHTELAQLYNNIYTEKIRWNCDLEQFEGSKTMSIVDVKLEIVEYLVNQEEVSNE